MIAALCATAWADEGMWMANTVDKKTAELCNYVVSIDFRGTGSLISGQGLVLTNHHYFLNTGKEVNERVVDWSAVLGVIVGAVVANLVKWGFPAINGMVVAAVIWGLGQLIQKRK